MGFRTRAAPILGALVIAMTAGAPRAEDSAERLGAVVRTLEVDLGGRIGVPVEDNATGWTWGHR
ncbi:hypothetical protein [Acuticoccus sediminis]|uniref:hypothetical protein n=1 Tax=Acuticoccus sediminis TaxID=2184697 RepID=UPI00192E565E|nr:hypothetical protein [Acuticoccus sediminis]